MPLDFQGLEAESIKEFEVNVAWSSRPPEGNGFNTNHKGVNAVDVVMWLTMATYWAYTGVYDRIPNLQRIGFS